jgi:lipid-A-disaccharide synthase
MVVAGEVSGDLHAGNMLGELRALDPSVSAFGIGGERLAENGLELVAHTDELAHMGLVEVIRELPRLRAVMRATVAEAARRRPAAAVLVDSPDFNLRLAARLVPLGIPVVLYVSPQLWAWRRGRVRTVRRLAREVLCILPFEVDFYHQHGVPARYVGHPLVDDMARDGLRDQQLERDPGRIALLPGSRGMEVRSLLPAMLEALRELPADRVREAVLVEAPGMCGVIDGVLTGGAPDPRLRRVRGRERRRGLGGSVVAWTASGTATLECALLDVPMVVGYRLQPVSYALAKVLVRVPHVALANLIAGDRVAPELIQREWCPQRLVEATLELMGEAGTRQRAALRRVRERLGGPGASRRAAESVLEIMGGSPAGCSPS